jgi:hypothetical protein
MIDPYVQDHPGFSTSPATLRQFAALLLVIFGAMGVWEYFWNNQQTAALMWTVLAGVLGFGGLIWPRGIRPVFVTAMALTMPVGWAVSKCILAILFFCLFTPIGILFRLIGRDVLRRRYAPDQESYWEVKPSAPDIRSYLRQS